MIILCLSPLPDYVKKQEAVGVLEVASCHSFPMPILFYHMAAEPHHPASSSSHLASNYMFYNSLLLPPGQQRCHLPHEVLPGLSSYNTKLLVQHKFSS